MNIVKVYILPYTSTSKTQSTFMTLRMAYLRLEHANMCYRLNVRSVNAHKLNQKGLIERMQDGTSSWSLS